MLLTAFTFDENLNEVNLAEKFGPEMTVETTAGTGGAYHAGLGLMLKAAIREYGGEESEWATRSDDTVIGVHLTRFADGKAIILK